MSPTTVSCPMCEGHVNLRTNTCQCVPDERGNLPHRFLSGPQCDLTKLEPDEYVRASPPRGWLVYRDDR